MNTNVMCWVCTFLCWSVVAKAQCIEGDCQNGQGTFLYPNGNKYKGEFRQGKRQGKGLLTFGNGNAYNGDWLNDQRDGYGTFTFANGNVYQGAVRQNRFSGKGTMTFVSGNKYIGEWINDQANGQGKFYFATGDRYEGAFRNGQFEGVGIFYFKNRDRYVGDWKSSERHGRGKMYFANGSVQDGFWEEGLLKKVINDDKSVVTEGVGAPPNFNRNCNLEDCQSGVGTYTYGDGSKWQGTFRDGLPAGKGTLYYANGDKYEGQYERHAPHGEGILYQRTGRTVSAIWEYGRVVGAYNPKQSEPAVASDKSSAVKVWAVVVGVGRYTSMPVLKYSDDDAYQFYSFLKSPEGGALPDSQIKVLVDDDATRDNILRTMRQILWRADENDAIIFYFSGHGVDGSFLPQDFDGSRNMVQHSEVKAIFEQSKAKHKLCIADACYSGSLLAVKTAGDKTISNYYKAFEGTSGGLALFMSSKSQEYSLEDQGLRSGIFSHYLIKGLKGTADSDRNNIVTIREVYDYVYKNVRSYTSNAQTPVINGDFDWNMPVGVVRQ